MDIHIRLDGDIIDLLALSDDQYKFYQKCLLAFRQNTPYDEYLKVIQDENNVLLKNMTLKEAFQTPLGKAVVDLGDRLAIQQGLKPSPDTEFVNIDPCQAEEYVTSGGAAKMKGMTVPSINTACHKGKLAAHQNPKNGRWSISKRALERYEVHKSRQANRLGKTMKKSPQE
jgi:hypothetical protein